MAQIIGVILFLWLTWTSCWAALSTGAFGKIPVCVISSWMIAIVAKLIITFVIDFIDRQLENMVPLVTEMNVQRASDRAYSMLQHSHKFLNFREYDSIKFTDSYQGLIMQCMRFITPWEWFYGSFGETITCQMDFTTYPNTNGTIIYVTFTSNCVPRAIKLWSPIDRIIMRNKLKRALEAKDAYDLPRRHSSFADAEHEYEQAQYAHEDRDFEIALDHIHRAIEIRSDKAAYWNQLGNTLLGMQMYQEARPAYERAIEIEPKEGYLYANLGLTFYNMEDYEKARKYILQANKLGYYSQNSSEVLRNAEQAMRQTL